MKDTDARLLDLLAEVAQTLARRQRQMYATRKEYIAARVATIEAAAAYRRELSTDEHWHRIPLDDLLAEAEQYPGYQAASDEQRAGSLPPSMN
jgi:hypothetical protein